MFFAGEVSGSDGSRELWWVHVSDVMAHKAVCQFWWVENLGYPARSKTLPLKYTLIHGAGKN